MFIILDKYSICYKFDFLRWSKKFSSKWVIISKLKLRLLNVCHHWSICFTIDFLKWSKKISSKWATVCAAVALWLYILVSDHNSDQILKYKTTMLQFCSYSCIFYMTNLSRLETETGWYILYVNCIYISSYKE
jgi:hypothetical protein